MTPRYFCLAAAWTALAGCRPSPATPAPAPADAAGVFGVPGTYELAVCRAAPCVPRDSAAAYLLATVVLFDSAGAAAADMPRAQYEMAGRSTGCMVIRHRRRVVGDSYAGISARAYFVWRGAGDSVDFPLYRSPDAWYLVRARLTARGLVGAGTSGGVGVAEMRGPRDSVVAVRAGPPDRLRCHTAG